MYIAPRYMLCCLTTYGRPPIRQKRFDQCESNDVMQFLIFTREEDDHKGPKNCYRSTNALLRKSKKLFPGDVELADFSWASKPVFAATHRIYGRVVPKTVYMKLNKLDMYVLSQEYPRLLLLTRMQELNTIFRELRAKRIKLAISQNTSSAKEFASQLAARGIGGGFEFSNNRDNSNELMWEKHFDFDPTPVDERIFGDRRKFYYLPREYDWRELVRDRFGNQTSVTYTLHNREVLSFTSKIESKLQMVDVDFRYNASDLNELTIRYEVEYHPLVLRPNLTRAPARTIDGIIDGDDEEDGNCSVVMPYELDTINITVPAPAMDHGALSKIETRAEPDVQKIDVLVPHDLPEPSTIENGARSEPDPQQPPAARDAGAAQDQHDGGGAA